VTIAAGTSAQTTTAANSHAPLSILHVVAPAAFGGLESVVRALASGHAARGHAVRVAIVISPGSERHPFETALESDGIRVTPIRVGNRSYLAERRAVRTLCRIEKVDVVHTHGYRPDVVDGSVARGMGIATVSTCHGFIDAGLRGRFYQWLQRQALRRFDAVVAVSEPIAMRLKTAGVPASRIHVIQNVVAPRVAMLSREKARARIGLSGAAPVIGWVGRLSTEKGPDVALQAFAKLPAPTARLVMIGAGPDGVSLRQQADALGIADRVIWTGALPDARGVFAAFDVFLLSSRTEGTPIALLEAVAGSIPVVATRVGGVPDTLDPDAAALVESEDPDAMAAALAGILANAAAARDRARRAQAALAARFDRKQSLSQYESVYRAATRAKSLGKRAGE
jgi:glycosyltransferase involved in cell wall biosynthesis